MKGTRDFSCKVQRRYNENHLMEKEEIGDEHLKHEPALT